MAERKEAGMDASSIAMHVLSQVASNGREDDDIFAAVVAAVKFAEDPPANAITDVTPYTLQADEGGTFLQSEAGQLFICADIHTVRRCLMAIGTPPDLV